MLEREAYRLRNDKRDANRKRPVWQHFRASISNPERIIQILLVVVTFALAVIGFLQWETLEKTEQTLKTTIAATQRPWLSTQVRVSGPFLVDLHGNANFQIDIYLKNMGNSVAGAVEIDIRAFSAPFDTSIFQEPRERQRALCNKARAETIVDQFRSRLTIFAGEDYLTPLRPGISKSEMVSSAFQGENDKFIFPFLYGCVTYRSAYSERAHQTGFIYSIHIKNPSEPAHPRPIKLGDDVPRDDILLERWFFSGNYAD